MAHIDFRISNVRNRMDFHYAKREERIFNTLADEKIHNLSCAIIEQAAWDWRQLEFGKYPHVLSSGHYLIHRAEVEAFFQSKWFEHLLSFALPDFSPEEVRRALKIAEPSGRPL